MKTMLQYFNFHNNRVIVYVSLCECIRSIMCYVFHYVNIPITISLFQRSLFVAFFFSFFLFFSQKFSFSFRKFRFSSVVHQSFSEMERVSFSSHLGNSDYKQFKNAIFDSRLDTSLEISLCNIVGRLVKVSLRDIRTVVVAAETLMLINQYKLVQMFSEEEYKIVIRRDLFGNIRFTVRRGSQDDRSKSFYYPSVLALLEDVCECLPNGQ